MERVPISYTSSSGWITELYRRTEEVVIKLNYLEDVKIVAKKFHQKVLNKKFLEAIKVQNPFLYGSIELQSGGYHKLHIMISTIQSYYRNDLMNVYNCEYLGIIANNRLDADALNKFLDTLKDNLVQHYNKLWKDIHTGEDRLRQYNELVNQLNELKDTFSSDFTSLRNLDFRIAYKP